MWRNQEKRVVGYVISIVGDDMYILVGKSERVNPTWQTCEEKRE